MSNIVSGMRYLADYEIVHLDIKPSNIIIGAMLVPKIIDYGEAYHSTVCSASNSPVTQSTDPVSPFPTRLLRSTRPL